MQIVKRLKNDLSKGDTSSSIEYLSSANNLSIFKQFRENKLLLIPENRSELFSGYEYAAKRLLTGESLNTELHYLSFLRIYLTATTILKKQIHDLMLPYFNRCLKEFMFLTIKVVARYESQITEDLYRSLQKDKLDKTAIDELSETHEWAHNMARGQIMDMLFAETNLLNLFGTWQDSNKHEEFMGVNGIEDVDQIVEMLRLSSNINSYQYALDKVSYGEWIVSDIKTVVEKPIFTFQIIDERLEKARDLGLKRETSDMLFVKKKKKRWLRDSMVNFATNAFDEAWDYYQNSSSILFIDDLEYKKGKERVLGSLEILDAEDELLVGMNLDQDQVVATYFIACILLAYTTAAEYFKHRSDKHQYLYTCPEIPMRQINSYIERTFVLGKPIINCLNLFICWLPLRQHLDLFKMPFIQDKDEKVYAVDYLSSNWTSLAKSLLMQGGKTADVVGKSWEGYIADILRKSHWSKVVNGLKLKENGRLLTDIDIAAKRDDVLFIVQMKVYYGTGINHYEQWKFRSKLEQAAKQVKISEIAILKDPNVLIPHFTKAELEEIKRIQPLVMTNVHIYNGWQYDEVPIMSTGSLMQIINGASVKFQTTDGSTLYEKKYSEGNIVSIDEFVDFLEKPLDWRIGSPDYSIEYHEEEFEHCNLRFPFLTNNENSSLI